MITRRTRGVDTELEEAQRRFERWRRTRPPKSRSPIPEGLWALAVGASQEHGLNPTCRALRLNYTALKERVRAAGGRRHAQPPLTTFVELAPPPTVVSPCTVELENAQGSKMKIHLASLESLDLVALIRNLWSSKR
ncbi:MAG: hypothetical protein ACRD3O_02350 [Terriglobia bacterium]